jgi:hypothetical protein
VIPTGKGDLNPELELYPVMVRLLRHQTQAQRPVQTTSITSVMTGLGGMAISELLYIDFVRLVCLFDWVLRHTNTVLATLQLYWWIKTSVALSCITSGTNGHLSRTNDVP